MAKNVTVAISEEHNRRLTKLARLHNLTKIKMLEKLVDDSTKINHDRLKIMG